MWLLKSCCCWCSPFVLPNGKSDTVGHRLSLTHSVMLHVTAQMSITCHSQTRTKADCSCMQFLSTRPSCRDRYSECVVTNAQQKALHSVAFHCQRRSFCAFTFIALTFSSEEASLDLPPGIFSQALALRARILMYYSWLCTADMLHRLCCR